MREKLERSWAGRSLAGLATVAGGLAVTAAGFLVFARQAGGLPTFLSAASVLVGLALVEAGSWVNAGFYRRLEGAAARPWLEAAGGALLAAGLAVFGNSLALAWMGGSAGHLGWMAGGLVLIELGLAAEHRAIMRLCGSPSFPLTLVVVAAALLGAGALGLVSVVNARYFKRVHLSSEGYYALDQRTVHILKALQKPLRIVSTMAPAPNAKSQEEESGNVIRSRAAVMLEEYAAQSRLVDYVRVDVYTDPDARQRLEDQLGMALAPDTIVFAYDGRTRVIDLNGLIAMSANAGAPALFRGEEAFTAALQALVEGRTTRVCFVRGHGEKRPDDFGERDGISALAELVRGDNCEIADCQLPDLPDPCDVLVIAGPRKAFLPAELDAVRAYLDERRGGLIALLDPVLGDMQPSGLEPILRRHGIEADTSLTIIDLTRLLERAGVPGPVPTATIYTADFGGGPTAAEAEPHPIIRDLAGFRMAFHIACPVAPAAKGEPGGDPYAVELVRTSPRAYAKQGFDPADADTMRHDRAGDRAGPFAVAVARGPWAGQEQPKAGAPRAPARMLVVGDSDFITNRFLARGTTGNSILFRNAVAWAASREYKVGIPPKPFGQTHRIDDLTAARRTLAWWAAVFAPPFHILLIGLVVWWVRRR